MLSPSLRKNQSNHITWMSYSLLTKARDQKKKQLKAYREEILSIIPPPPPPDTVLLRAPRSLGSALSVCTSHWCLVKSFWLKVCIYSHTRGVKLGLGLGFMQTSQVLPHWLNQSFSFWTLSYTQRHCHVRIEKSPNCCYNIRSTQFPRISLYALPLRFVLLTITKVVKPVH